MTLLVLCCHPCLTPSTQVALTLRAVGGLRTAEIARAYLVPPTSMTQRLARAKRAIGDAGGRFELPAEPELTQRFGSVLQVLYLMFNEGYTATSGEQLQRVDLAAEALRLARTLRALRPDDGETAGLYALMLLIHSRRAARTAPDGSLVPLAEQDRARWDRAAIAEGVAVLTDCLANHPIGPYQVQAAIAAVHAEAMSSADTDWGQIVGLYGLLTDLAPSPVVTMNQAVAVAMRDGPRAGLDLLATLDGVQRLAGQHRLPAIRAHLLEQLGDHTAAIDCYRRAARLTTSVPEQNYLQQRADHLEFMSAH